MDNNNAQNAQAPHPDKNIEAQITAVDFAEPLSRDAPMDLAFDIVISFAEQSGETHTWRGEVSSAYGRPGTINATKTRAQITLEALAKIGYKNPDISQINSELVGKIVPIAIKWTFSDSKGQWYKNVFLGHGGIKKIDKSKALNIMRMIGGGGSTPAPAAPAAFGAAPQTPPPNPFAFRN